MTEPSADHDRFLVELVLRRRVKKGRRRTTFDVTCSPKTSESVVQEIRAGVPRKTIAALPPGRYAFEQTSLTGFSAANFPPDASQEHISTVGASLFRIMSRHHAQLVVLYAAMADKAAIEEVVDGMYETAISVVAETREVAKLQPGFLKVGVGPTPSVFVPFFEKGIDPTATETTESYGYLVVALEGTQFIGVVAVCAETNPFAEHASAAFAAIFEAAVRARERHAVKDAQRLIEQEIADLLADKDAFARTFGELESDEHIDRVGYAEELRRSGAPVPDA